MLVTDTKVARNQLFDAKNRSQSQTIDEKSDHSSQESPGEMKEAKSRQDLQKMRQTALRQLRQEEKARQNLKVRALTRRHALMIVLRIQTRRFHKFR